MEPITLSALITGGTGLLGGLANLFGGDEEQEKLDKIKEYVKKRKGETEKDYTDRLLQVQRLASQQKASRLRASQQKAAQYGIHPTDVDYSQVQDIDENTMNAIAALDELRKEELNRLDQTEMGAELNLSPTTGGERFVTGFLGGANIGSNIANMIYQPSTKVPDGAQEGEKPDSVPQKNQTTEAEKQIQLPGGNVENPLDMEYNYALNDTKKGTDKLFQDQIGSTPTLPEFGKIYSPEFRELLSLYTKYKK